MKKSADYELFKKSFQYGVVYGLIGVVLVTLEGHAQAQYMVRIQPMKMAAAEALWDSEDPAALSLFTIGDEKNRKDVFAIKIPGMLSFLAYNKFSGEVKGINELQREYEQQYGPGNYVPPVAISYWTFRLMVGAGILMVFIAFWGLLKIIKENYYFSPRVGKLFIFSLFLPYLANSTGWIFTEVARQPWVVFGVMLTKDAVSPAVSVGEVLTTLIGFTLVYAALMVADIYLLKKFATGGIVSTKEGI